MTNEEFIVHERTLLGAIDSFLGGLVHVRPYLASDYREQIERMAEHWLDAGGMNAIEAVGAEWLQSYLGTLEDRPIAERALHELYRWAVEHELTTSSPL